MFALSKFHFVLNHLLALIPTGSLVRFINGNWTQNFGLFIDKNPVALVLEGLVGRVHQYIEDQKATRIVQDAIPRMDDDLLCATEMICLLKKESKEAKLDDLMTEKHNVEKLSQDHDSAAEETEHLKKKIEELEEALIQKEKEMENLNERLAGKDKECQKNREELEELQARAVDNDFYCGYLEQKVKAHEVERRRLTQANTRLEERSRTTQEEASVFAGNPDQDINHGNEAQKNLELQKKVHTLEDRIQLPQQKNKKQKKKAKRKQKATVITNSMEMEKQKNNAMVEENRVRGNIFCNLGQLEEACECFLRVLDIDDNQADCRIRLGLCLLLLGRHREAMVQLEKLDGREDLVAAAKTLERMQCYGCPYYILGIAEDATLKEIEWAYRKRALKFNPDKCQVSQEERFRRKEVMKKVNHAKDLLCDAGKREEYGSLREFIKGLVDQVFGDAQFSRQ